MTALLLALQLVSQTPVLGSHVGDYIVPFSGGNVSQDIVMGGSSQIYFDHSGAATTGDLLIEFKGATLNHGFYTSGNTLAFAKNDSLVWRTNESGLWSVDTDRAYMYWNTDSSATQPAFIPQFGNIEDGIGGNDNEVSMIANNTERFTATNTTLNGLTYAKGQEFVIGTANESLTFAANPGDASKTTTNLIPDGALVLGVVTRATGTAATNCTSVDIGFDVDFGGGVDVDMLADNAALAQNTTTNNSNVTASWPLIMPSAPDVTITGVGGNCFGGTWSVTAYYITLTAQTSN